jgi:hypothetical protein
MLSRVSEKQICRILLQLMRPSQYGLTRLATYADGVQYCAGNDGNDTYIYDHSTRLLPSGKSYVRNYYAAPITALNSQKAILTDTPVVSTATQATPGSGVNDQVKDTGTPSATPAVPISNGAKAGIGVGVTLGGSVLIIAIFLLTWRRCVRKAPTLTMPDDSWTKPELHGMPFDKYKDARELDSKSLHELDAQDSHIENGVNTLPVEVEADIGAPEVEADRPVEVEANILIKH